jgi:hypothetical protein
MEIVGSNLHIVEILNKPCLLSGYTQRPLRCCAFNGVGSDQNMAVVAAIETAARVRRNAAESNLINIFAILNDVGAIH